MLYPCATNDTLLTQFLICPHRGGIEGGVLCYGNGFFFFIRFCWNFVGHVLSQTNLKSVKKNVCMYVSLHFLFFTLLEIAVIGSARWNFLFNLYSWFTRPFFVTEIRLFWGSHSEFIFKFPTPLIIKKRCEILYQFLNYPWTISREK